MLSLHQIVITSGADHELRDQMSAEEVHVGILEILRRHIGGDWGDVCAQDAKENQKALKTGARILSSYSWAKQNCGSFQTRPGMTTLLTARSRLSSDRAITRL
jgi:hypothetical protein